LRCSLFHPRGHRDREPETVLDEVDGSDRPRLSNGACWCCLLAEACAETVAVRMERSCEADSGANTGRTNARGYTFEDLVVYHVWFAPTLTGTPYFKVKVVKSLPGVPDDPAFFLPRRFSEVETVPESGIDGEHIWVAFRARRWDENRPPMSHVKTLGYQTTNVCRHWRKASRRFWLSCLASSESRNA